MAGFLRGGLKGLKEKTINVKAEILPTFMLRSASVV